MEFSLFRFRRFAAATLGVGLALQPVLVHGAFSDVSSSAHQRAVNALEERGVLKGYADGSFKPRAFINRAEFLKIVLLSAYTEQEIMEYMATVRVRPIDDVPSDAWYFNYVHFAMGKGIVKGYPDGLFHPEQNINFVEAAKIISLVYKQDAQSVGGEWYEPYARALDGSKAIPLSVAGLDKPITRGEMADMMWRVSENKTDQPAKGLLNLKYPDATVNFASDTVQTAKSCEDLRALADETQNSATMYYGRGGMMLEGDAVAAPAPVTGNAGAAAEESKAMPRTGGGSDGDYSTTNVQVEGVDEADIIKIDGDYLYILKNQSVRIVKTTPASSMKEVANLKLSTENFSPSNLYLDGTKMVVMGSTWEQIPYPRPIPMMDSMMKIAPGYFPPYYQRSRSVVRIYDITDRANPKMSREIEFDGNMVSSRKIGDKVYLVLQQPMMWAYPMLRGTAIPEADLMPTFSDSAKGGKDVAMARCNTVSILPHPASPEYITVATVPLTGTAQEVKHEVVVGSAQNIYASLENLYVAMTEWNYTWNPDGSSAAEKTHIYRFDFTSDGVDFKADGTVPGRILNQFSMDEHESTFRIATTRGSTWDTNQPSTNNLYILNMNLDQVGAVEDLAPGEQIYSTRFMGDRAYMVTFRQTDPLFVIDTSDARNPKVLGKLKIPGYSNYLHPYDETHLIGFGKEAVEAKDQNFAWYQGLKIALFDVTNPENPKEISNVVIGDRGSDSPLLYDHKALLFDKERGILSFPVLVSELTAEQKAKNESASEYGSPVWQGAYVFDISLSGGLKERGKITHYSDDTFKKAGDYWYSGTHDVQRVVRIGESLYTISNGAVQANRLSNLDKTGSVEMEGDENVRYY
jgi:inhibitor of cysteine peptidase